MNRALLAHGKISKDIFCRQLKSQKKRERMKQNKFLKNKGYFSKFGEKQ